MTKRNQLATDLPIKDSGSDRVVVILHPVGVLEDVTGSAVSLHVLVGDLAREDVAAVRVEFFFDGGEGADRDVAAERRGSLAACQLASGVGKHGIGVYWLVLATIQRVESDSYL